MKINSQISFIEITKSASSLYSLMADGQYRSTSLGRDKWKSVVGPDASLQLNCNKEGFNAECTMTARSKKQESVSLLTRTEIATLVILGSGLAQEEIMMTLTHVETTLDLAEIMGISVLKPWDTFWYSERELLLIYTISLCRGQKN